MLDHEASALSENLNLGLPVLITFISARFTEVPLEILTGDAKNNPMKLLQENVIIDFMASSDPPFGLWRIQGPGCYWGAGGFTVGALLQASRVMGCSAWPCPLCRATLCVGRGARVCLATSGGSASRQQLEDSPAPDCWSLSWLTPNHCCSLSGSSSSVGTPSILRVRHQPPAHLASLPGGSAQRVCLQTCPGSWLCLARTLTTVWA